MDSMVSKYSEMGSRDKKTGKLKYYVVTLNHNTHNASCECVGHMYRPYQDCKHIKRLKQKLCIA
jgi:hypothetical protein